MKTSAIFLTAVSTVAAWPAVIQMDAEYSKRLAAIELSKRADVPNREPLVRDPRPNTGNPPAGFNAAEQYVDVTDNGPNPFIAPGPNDRRGQCPGLNAVANHGFFPRNGLPTIQDTITGLGKAYAMAPDLALALAVISVGLAGDPLTQTWSIGGSFPASIPLLQGQPKGIVGTHNKYENDGSIVKGDAYLNGGNVGVFQTRSFTNLYNMGQTYGFNEVHKQSDYVQRWSVANNPYAFWAPFSGLVAPAAHDFVIRFMSNHSATVPGGTLTRDVLKSFFSVTGEPGSFVHTRGYERIPLNWYRQPNANAHTLPEVFTDLLATNAAYPGTIRLGGNTGTVNSYTGVNSGDLTGGVFNSATLLQGNNLACFFLQASIIGMPDAAIPALGAAGSILGWAEQQLGPLSSKLQCPPLANFNNALFNQFPGAAYTGSGTAK